LEPRADGKGQVLACEMCIATPAIRKLIRDGESHLMVNEIYPLDFSNVQFDHHCKTGCLIVRSS
jgi:Tfp pilus assembly pilus retraction ATPase PilT